MQEEACLQASPAGTAGLPPTLQSTAGAVSATS